MPGPGKEWEKLNHVPCFCNEFSFLPWKKVLFNQTEDRFNAFTVCSLMCSHLFLWTVNKTEICMYNTLPPQAQASSETRCWESKESSLRYVGILEGHRKGEPTPQHLSEFSSSSRFQPHFFPFSIQRGERVPLSWAGKSLEDWGTLSCALVRGCCWQLDLWLITEKTVLSPGKKPLCAGDVKNHQWCSSWDCVWHQTSPSGLNVLPTPYLSPILWMIFSLFYSSYVFIEMLTLYNEKLL